jgi:hypothetical protein
MEGDVGYRTSRGRPSKVVTRSGKFGALKVELGRPRKNGNKVSQLTENLFFAISNCNKAHPGEKFDLPPSSNPTATSSSDRSSDQAISKTQKVPVLPRNSKWGLVRILAIFIGNTKNTVPSSASPSALIKDIEGPATNQEKTSAETSESKGLSIEAQIKNIKAEATNIENQATNIENQATNIESQIENILEEIAAADAQRGP